MHKRIKWGILGTATIAIEQVVPALVASKYGEVYAIASRDKSKAKKAALQFDIPTYYGGYQELLDDTTVEAVYIPLPNHLHVEWAIKAIHAGKHVLVEKPIALSSAEAQELVNVAKKTPKAESDGSFYVQVSPAMDSCKENGGAG